TYTYGTGGGTDDCASRVQTVKYGVVTGATYKYLGAARHVYTELNQTSCYQDPTNGNAGDYQRRDRFDRGTKSIWQNAGVGCIYDVEHSYDRNGGIYSTVDQNKHNGSGYHNYDALYTNDDLGRLLRAQNGTVSGLSLSHASRDEQWTDNSSNPKLSQTGN